MQHTSNTLQDTLQHTAVHCNTLQHAATQLRHTNDEEVALEMQHIYDESTATYYNIATHCNTLQHTATHCNTLQHTATHCNTLQRTATHLRHIDDEEFALEIQHIVLGKVA